jgi:carboxyl-terminal processing protease
MEGMAIIQNNYVDEDKVTSQKLVAGAIKGMMSQLDPFSQYMDLTESSDMNNDTQGSFGGLGIEISLKAKVLTVVSPIEDTPADKAGIKSGDAILKIDGTSTDNIELMDAVHKMRGEPGTKVTISVWREGFTQPRDFTMARAVIKIRSVKSNLLDGKVGYIRLSSFMGKSAEDFGTAMDQLESQGAESLIIDVRNNPGGLLNAAAKISGHFVPQGKVVVSTAGRYKDKDMRFESEGDGHWDKPTVIMVNGGSASASEILAGALQDYGLAVVVGTKSFGKGSVQTILPLSDGSALRLTTAKYLTPKGRSLHGQGIDPDLVVEEEAYSKAVLDLIDADSFALFWKDYLVEHPTFTFKDDKPRVAVKVSESSWQALKPESKQDHALKDFADWMGRHGKPLSQDTLAQDHGRLVAKLEEELARKQGGEDAAREAALDEDPQVKAALGVLKVAKVYQAKAH